MNKFAAFAFLAVAAVALSVSAAPIDDNEEDMTQAAMFTTDAEETAQLAPKNLEAFNDFCISSRDYVLADMKRQSGELTSKAFGLVFGSAAEIGKESLEVQNKATERLAAQLANPDAPIEGASDAIDQVIADGQSQIHGQSAPQGFLTAFKTAVSAVSQKAGGLVADRLNYLKSLASPQQLVSALSGGCVQIANYESELRSQFESYKTSSLGSDAAKYASLSLDQVPCATSTKIIRSEGLCTLVNRIVDPVKKIWFTGA